MKESDKMPSAQEIKENIRDAGFENEVIEKKANEIREKYGAIMNNDNLLYLKVAKSLNVPVNLPEVQRRKKRTRKDLKVKDILSENCPDRFNIEGYVVNEWETTTRKGNDAIKFHLIDSTGVVSGAVYKDEGINNWMNANVELFKKVRIENANRFVFTTDDGREFVTLTATYSDIIPSTDDKGISHDIKDIDNMLIDDGELGYIRGMVVGEEIRDYEACTQCGKKIADEIGECERCGNDEVETRYFQTLFINTIDTCSTFSATLPPNLSSGESMDGAILEGVGRWNSADEELVLKGYKKITSDENINLNQDGKVSPNVKMNDLNEREHKIFGVILENGEPMTIDEIANALMMLNEDVSKSVNNMVTNGHLFIPEIGKVATSKEIAENIGYEPKEDDTGEEIEDKDDKEDEGDEETYKCHYCERELKSAGGRTRHEKSSHVEQYMIDNPDEFPADRVEQAIENQNDEDKSNTSETEDTSTEVEHSELKKVVDKIVKWLELYPPLPTTAVKNYVERNIVNDTEYDIDTIMDAVKSDHRVDSGDDMWKTEG